MATDTPTGTVQFSTCGDASALHASFDNGDNLISIGNLRVIIKPESDNMWVAQGLEIDFAADGTSLEDVQRAFTNGLSLTLKENIRIFGSILPVLRSAPKDIWDDFLTAAVEHQFMHSQSAAHKIAGMAVCFYVQKQAA